MILKLQAVLGIFVFLLIAFLMSRDKKRIDYKLVALGLVIQFAIALFMLKTSIGVKIFEGVNKGFLFLLNYSNYGARFLFGNLVDSQKIGAQVAFQVLPLIVFVSALMYLLVYLGVIQFFVKLFAKLFYHSMKITGVESFTSSLLIFMGIEALTGIKKYLESMNESRLFTIMTTFMSTIAGSVMAAYVSFGAKAGHLLTASVMSAPAAILISKIMIPDTEKGEKDTIDNIKVDKGGSTIVEAIATGTSNGLRLALEVGAMLIAFISLIYLLNDIIGISGITLEKLLGYIFSPFAILIGISPSEALEVGKLLGVKTVFNEFLSFLKLKTYIAASTLSPRAIYITTYALCGFSNFGSMGILIAGIGTMAPRHKSTVSRLAFKSMIAGFLATMLTASIAGILL